MSELQETLPTQPHRRAETVATTEDRGVLDVRKKAVESIVLHAASAVPGTVRVGGMVQRLRRSTWPSASVTLRGGRAWVDLHVAAAWPCPAERLADNVRRQVYTEAAELSSVHIERLDVTLHVVDAAETSRSRSR